MKTQNLIQHQHRYPALKLAQITSVFCRMLLVSVVYVTASPVNADTKLASAGIQNMAELPALLAVGHGELTWFGLSIYQASLWTATGEYRNLKDSIPIALTITYQKNIDSDALAQRTVKEWSQLGIFDNDTRTTWGQRLSQIWPDVVPGDSITTLVTGDGNTHFYHNNSLLTVLDDPSFGIALLSIWLDPKTSEPDLRAKLIDQKED
jgi:hypothetical protein